MNVFLGSYGDKGNVNMEVDYIRAYNWPLKAGNELPNPGFEDSGSLLPWEGTGKLANRLGRDNSIGLELGPGQKVEQYIYLDNDREYTLAYWLLGGKGIRVNIFNVEMVTGDLEEVLAQESSGQKEFLKKSIPFKTGKEYNANKKTIKLVFENTGHIPAILDDITIEKSF
ncbi:hypothetical protein [Pedobacter sp. HDW13]|uniref:hypothetical protein n=1 Tax=Pedobacter sp. HDW13 TaxID=2714940 RepID=UPI00197EE49F|nr:hypothetical protein [Pedobacter sp. HDW13]